MPNDRCVLTIWSPSLLDTPSQMVWSCKLSGNRLSFEGGEPELELDSSDADILRSNGVIHKITDQHHVCVQLEGISCDRN